MAELVDGPEGRGEEGDSRFDLLVVAMFALVAGFMTYVWWYQRPVEVGVEYRRGVVAGEVVRDEAEGRNTYEVLYYRCAEEGLPGLQLYRIALLGRDMLPGDTFELEYRVFESALVSGGVDTTRELVRVMIY